MTLFKNKYRAESTRLTRWDYGDAGFYYITICTKERVRFLGDVVAGDMVLSRMGVIVAEEWLRTGELRKNVTLDEWIIMPNHLHLILVITQKLDSTGASGIAREAKTPQQGISTEAASKRWRAHSVGSIIGQFKGACTKRIWAEGFHDFAWQSRFYDHVIRTDETLSKTRQYIASNPANWYKDQDNISGLYM